MLLDSLFLKKLSPDTFFISNWHNIGYLTGFWGSFGKVLLFKNGEIILFSDARYSLLAHKLCEKNGMEYVEISPKDNFWKEFLERKNIKIVGIEADHVTLSQFQRLKKVFGKNVVLKKTKNLMENLRKIKSEEEISLLQKSAVLNDLALQKTIPFLKEGVTEQEIAWIFEKITREELGAEKLAFSTIVAFGKNSAIPHHSPISQKLQKNMPVLIDCGVQKNKYCSDMTRCFWYGKPSVEWIYAYELVLKAQKEGMQKIQTGNSFSDPDIIAREIFGEKESYFTHSFGHGVGLEIHEMPSLSALSKGKFLKNMVVTAEPGLYFPEKFGIRIEDMCIVQEKQNPECFSKSPKDISKIVLC